MTDKKLTVKICKECGEAPVVTKGKGVFPTTVICEECDRKASSGIAYERAIQLWNQMNKERD
jgi:hypothetical protein